MDLSILIVNWNSKEFLEKCLHSIFSHTSDIKFEVIVIDSGSFDGCDRMLNESYPSVRFIQSQINLGFARANNRAFQEAAGMYALFLNPDTEIVGAAVIALYSHLKSLPNAGMVGARLLNSDGSLQTSCIQSMPTIANKILDSAFLRARWPHSKLWGTAALFDQGAAASEVDAISGACLMIKSSVFREVGGFSEDYFMYAEDIDLAYKVYRAGYRKYFVPQSTVVHHGGNSTARAPNTFTAVMMPEATFRFFRKTRGRRYAAAYRCGMSVNAIIRLVLLRVSRLLALSGRDRRSHQASLRKWRELLRWGLNRNTVVQEYYRDPVAARHLPR